MLVPLIVLAVLATVGGFVGISPAFTGGSHIGGRLNIVNWLEPVIWDRQTGEFKVPHGAESGHASTAETITAAESHSQPVDTVHASGFNLAHSAEAALGSHTATEWLFIVISLIVAAVGITLGLLFYIKSPRLPEIWAQRLRPLYLASYNKYWVDEFYGATVTRRVMDAARAVFAFDSRVIDGLVNGSAWVTRTFSRITGGVDKYFVDGIVNAIAAFIIRLMSPLFRAAQTGFAQNYALVMVLGLVAAVTIFFGADIMKALRSVFAFSGL
jgi:NADH-quinone oxidoreductase subunit L